MKKIRLVIFLMFLVTNFSMAQINLDLGLVAYYPLDGNLDNPTLQFTSSATFSFWMRLNSTFEAFGNGSTENRGNHNILSKFK